MRPDPDVPDLVDTTRLARGRQPSWMRTAADGIVTAGLGMGHASAG